MKRVFALFVLMCLFALRPATASQWEKVVSSADRTVEIDTSAIFEADRGVKVAWGRIVLNTPEATRAGYHTIKAMNRYDCAARTFMTVKRVYLDETGDVLREEIIPEQVAIPVRRHSVDEQIWNKICGALPAPDQKRPRGHIEQVADAADRAVQGAGRDDAVKTEPLHVAEKVLPVPEKPAPPKIRPIPMPAAPSIKPVATVPTKRAVVPHQNPAKSVVLPAPISTKVSAPPPTREVNTDWGYFGADGPESWGNLHPNWKLCSGGKQQSPVDLSVSGAIQVDLEPVKFDYHPANFVINNGTRQLRVKIGDGMSMEVRGHKYLLDGLTLHRPAETRIKGTADMEVHFFHRDSTGRIAVLAVQFMRGDETSAPLQTLLNNLPLESSSYTPQAMLDMTAFLPKSPAHYLYMGSLTMPPCTEGVLWVVMKEPKTLSEEQYGIFSRLHASNARPPQPANARLILESR